MENNINLKYKAYYTGTLGKDFFKGNIAFNENPRGNILKLQEEIKDLYGYDVVQIKRIEQNKFILKG